MDEDTIVKAGFQWEIITIDLNMQSLLLILQCEYKWRRDAYEDRGIKWRDYRGMCAVIALQGLLLVDSSTKESGNTLFF